MAEQPSGRIIRFTVMGEPVRWQRPGQTKTGRRFSPKEVEDAKLAIAHEAALVWKGLPYMGPCRISGVFIFSIPKSWPPALRAAAHEGRVDHISDPDIDQLLKLVMDGLSDLLVVDDNQFSRFGRSAKRYGGPARSEIVIELLEQPPDAVTPGQKRIMRDWANGRPPPKPPREKPVGNSYKTKFRKW
jgi:Holliday junction resolvase RusA-like endonuclease